MRQGDAYSIDYTTAKRLRRIAVDERELGAIARLEAFEGDEDDLRLAAAMYDRAGDREGAEALRWYLPEHVVA